MNEPTKTKEKPSGVELMSVIWVENQGPTIIWNQAVLDLMIKDGNIKMVTEILLSHVEDLLQRYEAAHPESKPSGLVIPA